MILLIIFSFYAIFRWYRVPNKMTPWSLVHYSLLAGSTKHWINTNENIKTGLLSLLANAPSLLSLTYFEMHGLYAYSRYNFTGNLNHSKRMTLLLLLGSHWNTWNKNLLDGLLIGRVLIQSTNLSIFFEWLQAICIPLQSHQSTFLKPTIGRRGDQKKWIWWS